MTAHTATVIYLNASTETERTILHKVLAPHSWACGEFGLILTDVAFRQCVMTLSDGIDTKVKVFLNEALASVRKAGAGDICLNFGIVA